MNNLQITHFFKHKRGNFNVKCTYLERAICHLQFHVDQLEQNPPKEGNYTANFQFL